MGFLMTVNNSDKKSVKVLESKSKRQKHCTLKLEFLK